MLLNYLIAIKRKIITGGKKSERSKLTKNWTENFYSELRENLHLAKS
jgi:hypothetical protein